MDPFRGMSQDQMKKLDEVLQSDQAKALLEAPVEKLFGTAKATTLVANEDNDVSSIMNTSMESLGALSDLEGVEPTINVANDVDVVHIATDIFYDELPKAYDFVHMDHTYSMPAAGSKLDILDVKHETAGSSKKETYEPPVSVDLKSVASTPIRRSLRQQEKGERIQKEKENIHQNDIRVGKAVVAESVTSPLECIPSGTFKETSDPCFDLGTEKPLLTSETKIDAGSTPIKGKSTPTRNSCEKLLEDNLLTKEGKSKKLHHSVDLSENILSGFVKHSPLKGPSKVGINGSDFHISNNVSHVKSLQKEGTNQNEIFTSIQKTELSKTTDSLPKKLNVNQKVTRTNMKKLGNKNTPKKNSAVSEDVKPMVRHNSGRRVSGQSESSEKQCVSPSSSEKLNRDKEKKPNPSMNNPRKKSLSFSEDKKEESQPPAVKKRHLSVSEKDAQLSKNNLAKPKIKPKKKISRSDSISADLLGPALFSEPDVMVKVKTNDDPVTPDAKAEKNKAKSKDDMPKAPPALPSNEKIDANVDELDLIKAEMGLEQESAKSDPGAAIVNSEPEPEQRNAEEKPSASPMELKTSIKVEDNSIKSENPAKVIKSENTTRPLSPEKPAASEAKVQRSTPLRSQKCSPSTIKDFLVTKNKNNSHIAVDEAKNVEEDVKQHETVAVCDKPTKSVEEPPQPARKSKRTIQRKRRFDEDYSPEVPARRKKNSPTQAAKNESPSSSKVEAGDNSQSSSRRQTRRRATAVHALVAKMNESGEDSDENEQNENTNGPDDSNDSDWDSEDDPEKLWCICRKPHNNKFMIQCDKCEDWFHGTCVSVTRQLGRLLEKEGKEWHCPNCSKNSTGKGRGANPSAVTNKSALSMAERRENSKNTAGKREAASLEKQASVRADTKRAESGKDGSQKPQDSTKGDGGGKPAVKTVAAKDKGSAEKIQTRSPIPKDFVLKSRDPAKEKEAIKPEKLPVKAEKTPVKSEKSSKPDTRGTRSVLKAEKSEANPDRAQKSPVEQEPPPASNFPGKQILLKELTVVNNVIVRERSVVGVAVNQDKPLHLKATQAVSSSAKSAKSQESPQTQKTRTASKTSNTGKESKASKEIRKLNCVVCSKPAPPRSIYCSNLCLEKYSAESVRVIQNSLKPTDDVNSTKVTVIDRLTNKLVSDVGAPKVGELASWLKSNPSFEVLRPTTAVSSKKEQKVEPKYERDDPEEAAKLNIRLNARKTLKKILLERCQNADDIKMSEDEVQKISTKIEEELHRYLKDNSFKYRSKYRSLMFNIKDPRNRGLFRKILKGKILPNQLVRMSTEELASLELAKWREQENQHNIDLIKRTQIEQLQGCAGVRKKTHKGEIEIEEDAIGLDPTDIDKEVPKTPPRPVEETIEVTPEKKEKKEEKETDKDTTSLHRSHLFDLNCKICTGKMPPPPPEEQAPKKIRVAHSISHEQTSPKVSECELITRTSIGETSDDSVDQESSAQKKAESSVWKGFIYMQDVAKFVTSAYKVSGPTDFLQQDIPDTIQVCGRIVPDQVWDYLSKIKQSGNKELIVIRFRPANEEEAMTYDLFYNYLNSRKRCGVVNNNYSKMLKDFYILPLAAHKPVPTVLMPFDGPGLPSLRPHLLLGVLVRHQTKQKDTKNASKFSQDKTEDVSYTPPLDSNSPLERYTPPMERCTYTPPLDSRSYTSPLQSCTFTPPPDNQSYTPPLVAPSYTPPLEDGSYTPPLISSPEPSEIGSSMPVYTPTPGKFKISSEKRSYHTHFNIAHKTTNEEPDEYEPSYTPPLEKMPKLETDSSSDDSRQFNAKSTFNASGGAFSQLMRRISESSMVSKASPLTVVSSSSSDLERQKMLLNELTRKVEETDRKVNQSLSEIQQLGAASQDAAHGSLAGDCIANFSTCGMPSFLNTKELQDVLNSVKPKSGDHNEDHSHGTSGQSHPDFKTLFSSTKDTDARNFCNFSPLAQNEPDNSLVDTDDRGSSLGGTPPLIGDEDDDENSTASELRPSDPRIKIRTNFDDDSFTPDEPKKTSLSDMSQSELVERAQKELETISTPEKTVGHYPVPCWESSKEPPPPGIDPSDLPPIETVSFPGVESSNPAHPSYPPAPPPLPESHGLGAAFVPSAPPASPAFPLPPPGFPIRAPPPTLEVAKSFPPPALPPAFMPPPNVPPPLPEGIEPRDEHYFRWPPEGPPSDVDFRERPPHWEEWDPRAPYDSERGPPPSDYFRDRKSPDGWHFSRRRREFRRDEFRDGHPPWSEEDWDHEMRYEGRGPRRWYNRHPRGNRMRGRRNYGRPARD